MNDPLCEEFQQTVANFLLRHQSILDILSKSQESCARSNRAVTKSITSCACLQVKTEKRFLPTEANLEDIKSLFSDHLEGELCDTCREAIINELGKNLFYITALCNTLGINLSEVLETENSKVTMLGRFNMT
jgi:hypothetical protein